MLWCGGGGRKTLMIWAELLRRKHSKASLARVKYMRWILLHQQNNVKGTKANED